MPPAFVLSQDQTLHKLKFVYQIIWSKHYLFDLRLIMNFQGLHRTIQFSISCVSFWGACFLIYHQFRFCQINFEDFFIFYSAPYHFKLNFISLSFGTFYNIEPIFKLCKSFFKLFQSFPKLFQVYQSALCRLPWFLRRRKTRYNIASRFVLSSRISKLFSFFHSARSTTPISWEANRDII